MVARIPGVIGDPDRRRRTHRVGVPTPGGVIPPRTGGTRPRTGNPTPGGMIPPQGRGLEFAYRVPERPLPGAKRIPRPPVKAVTTPAMPATSRSRIIDELRARFSGQGIPSGAPRTTRRR